MRRIITGSLVALLLWAGTLVAPASADTRRCAPPSGSQRWDYTVDTMTLVFDIDLSGCGASGVHVTGTLTRHGALPGEAPTSSSGQCESHDQATCELRVTVPHPAIESTGYSYEVEWRSLETDPVLIRGAAASSTPCVGVAGRCL